MKRLLNSPLGYAVMLLIGTNLLIAFLLWGGSLIDAQPDIITDPISHPPEFATHTPYPTGTAPIPDSTGIPFVPVRLLPTIDYRATLEVIGWNAP